MISDCLTVLIKFLLFASVFSHQGKKYPRVYWVTDPAFDDVLIRPNDKVDLPAQMDVVTPAEGATMTYGKCGEACMQRPWCSSFFADLKRNQCLVHEVVFFTPHAGKWREFAPGARYLKRYRSKWPSTKGFYSWRNESLTFKLFLQANHSLRSTDEIQKFCVSQFRGRLLQVPTLERMDWMRKVLLQMPSSMSFSVPFVDENKIVTSKRARQHGCKTRVEFDPDYEAPVFEKECSFKVDVKKRVLPGRYNFFCEVI